MTNLHLLLSQVRDKCAFAGSCEPHNENANSTPLQVSGGVLRALEGAYFVGGSSANGSMGKLASGESSSSVDVDGSFVSRSFRWIDLRI